jgi:hypothetical protein
VPVQLGQRERWLQALAEAPLRATGKRKAVELAVAPVGPVRTDEGGAKRARAAAVVGAAAVRALEEKESWRTEADEEKV